MSSLDRFSLLRDLQGLSVLVAGAGRQGLSAVRFLLQQGARVALADDTNEQRVLAALHRTDIDPTALRLITGGFTTSDLSGVALIVLSAGIPRTHPAIAHALQVGLPVVNEVELAAAHLVECQFVGITGTNGKSTTTTMLGDIVGAHTDSVFVGGNLGAPLCDALLAPVPPTHAVVELSSYQLETIEYLPLQAAVITNLAPDHLDRYESVDHYYAAKLRICQLVREQGGLVYNQSDATSTSKLKSISMNRMVPFGLGGQQAGIAVIDDAVHIGCSETERVISLENPHILGAHNRLNAAAAIAAALLLEISVETCQAGIQRYAGIEHRLEYVGSHQGVAWYNDSKATNVDAAVTALRSFSVGVHLILGGVGKGASYEPLVDAARGHVRAVYVIGQDAACIADAFRGTTVVEHAGTLDRAVEQALGNTRDDDVILLAPACASFDQFADYRARGQAFRELFRLHSGRGT